MIINDNNSDIFNIIEYLFVIFTVLQGNSIYYCHSSIVITIGWEFLLLLLCSILIIKSNDIPNQFFSYIGMYFIVVSLFLIFYDIYYPFSIKNFFVFLINPILLMFYFYNEFINNNNKITVSLFYKFMNIMFILAIISIISYFIYCLGVKPTKFYVSYIWGNRYNMPSYFGLCFFPTLGGKLLGLNFPIRNTGIFTEAPVFSYLLSLALFMNLFLLKHNNRNKIKSVVLFIAIVLTLSTNGIILSILAVCLVNIESHVNQIKKYFYVIFVPFLFILIREIFVSKQNYGAITVSVNSSYHVRSDNILASLCAWTKHIVIGNGLNNIYSIHKYMDPLRFLPGGDTGITSSFFEVLAFGGILLAMFYVVPLILSFFISRSIFYFAIFTFMYFLVEGVMYYNIYIIILSFCFTSYLLNKLVKRNYSYV